MGTIVRYTDDEKSQNSYPFRIVSPPRASACCYSAMEIIGEPERDGKWIYQYRRCRECGFAVRFALRQIPDEELMHDLRRIMAVSMVKTLS